MLPGPSHERPAMPPTLRLLLSLLCLTSATAFAAKKKAEPADAPPQLISTKGDGPKWTTLEQLKQFAAKGDPTACFELADRSAKGDGVPRDLKQATVLFEQAARGGVANGWFRLGKIYHDGLAGAPDYGRALDHFSTAAQIGVVEAQHNIGAMLVSARGVKRDYIEGLAWLIVAKKSGAASEAETQVRARLAKRPADITTAEARAVEIAKDLPHATVRAARSAAAAGKPLAPSAPSADKPPGATPKSLLPMTPAMPVVTPGKP